MEQRIVVTGGAGVLGSALTRALVEAGDKVYTVDIREPAGLPPNVEHRTGDVRDPRLLGEVCAGADAVVHAASALPSYPARHIRSVIVDGTRTVLDAARRAGVPRVVYISSTSVYGLPDALPTPEEHPLRPVDTYGRAKVRAEELCQGLRETGVCVPVLRPKTFLGPGRMGLFAMLFEWADEGHHFPVLGSGRVLTQMCATADVVTAVQAALAAPESVANDTFNVAATDVTTLRDDFQAVLDAAGYGKRVIPVPARPAVLVLQALARLHLSPVYPRLAQKLLADSYVSVERIRQRLGWQPRFSGRQALLDTFEWWRTHRAGTAVRVGNASTDPWRQGALALAKAFF
ncbi:MAG TPA: NAD-dependent epimerase/dehydratase family protein [Micromonosporaceae bacterium]